MRTLTTEADRHIIAEAEGVTNEPPMTDSDVELTRMHAYLSLTSSQS
jgi:hypothetical protein